MSDWEDIFGEGTSAESVIDWIDRSNRRERKEEEPERFDYQQALNVARANPGKVIVRIPGTELFMVKKPNRQVEIRASTQTIDNEISDLIADLSKIQIPRNTPRISQRASSNRKDAASALVGERLKRPEKQPLAPGGEPLRSGEGKPQPASIHASLEQMQEMAKSGHKFRLVAVRHPELDAQSGQTAPEDDEL